MIGYSNLSSLLSKIKFLEELSTKRDDKRINILKESNDGFLIELSNFLNSTTLATCQLRSA